MIQTALYTESGSDGAGTRTIINLNTVERFEYATSAESDSLTIYYVSGKATRNIAESKEARRSMKNLFDLILTEKYGQRPKDLRSMLPEEAESNPELLEVNDGNK